MRIFAISDNADFEVGMKLAGADSISLNNEEEINKKIDEILQVKDIGILVVSEKIYDMAKDRIDDIRLNKRLPLITFI